MLKKDELTIYLTSDCQLTCKHCYVDKTIKYELKPDDLLWILDNIQNKRTTFLGGEPLMYPYIKDCLEAFKGVTLATNGLLIDEKNIGMLKGINGVQISAEMGEKETNYLRGEKVWETLMEKKTLLEKEDVDYYFRVSFWEGNLAGLSEFFELDVPLVLFPRVDKPALPPQLTSRLFEEVLKHDDWVLALPNFMQYLGKDGRCKSGAERLNVYYDRRITPCNFDLNYTLGKVGQDGYTLEENIQTFVATNKTIPTECIGCKNANVCRGSCYAANVSVGCPLQYDFSISDFVNKYNVDKNDMNRQIGKMTNFMKKMLVC